MRLKFKAFTLAFTLVELLVVIAVLGILAGLLYPMVARVKEKGRQAQCANNLKELHTAVMAFASNNGRFPYATTFRKLNDIGVWEQYRGWVGPVVDMQNDQTPNNVGQMDMWDDPSVVPRRNGTACITNGSLFNYISDKRVYLCPTFGIELVKFRSVITPIRSYVMNPKVGDQNIYALKNGSSTMLFTELNVVTNFESQIVAGYAAVHTTITTIPADTPSVKYYVPKSTDGMICASSNSLLETIAAYHMGKGHVMFADGHAEFLTFSNTWDTASGIW